jgi:hypothetical protein
MALPTVALNETTPAGSAYIRDGDNRICEYKKQNREIMEVDHYYPSSGQNAACGRHKQLTLIEAADIGTVAEGLPILGAQTVAGKPELMYVSEDGDVQITNAGAINVSVTTLKTALINLLFPVGFIYVTTVATNPGTYLGGTWAACGAGRVLVGKAAAGTFATAGATGGAETHTLIISEMPAHTHTSNAGDGTGRAGEAPPPCLYTPGTPTSSTGGGGAHNNLQPYTVVYMWERTA